MLITGSAWFPKTVNLQRWQQKNTFTHFMPLLTPKEQCKINILQLYYCKYSLFVNALTTI